jgi:hypothetical protein
MHSSGDSRRENADTRPPQLGGLSWERSDDRGCSLVPLAARPDSLISQNEQNGTSLQSAPIPYWFHRRRASASNR